MDLRDLRMVSGVIAIVSLLAASRIMISTLSENPASRSDHWYISGISVASVSAYSSGTYDSGISKFKSVYHYGSRGWAPGFGSPYFEVKYFDDAHSTTTKQFFDETTGGWGIGFSGPFTFCGTQTAGIFVKKSTGETRTLRTEWAVATP
jgi:hypothetical protein